MAVISDLLLISLMLRMQRRTVPKPKQQDQNFAAYEVLFAEPKFIVVQHMMCNLRHV